MAPERFADAFTRQVCDLTKKPLNKRHPNWIDGTLFCVSREPLDPDMYADLPLVCYLTKEDIEAVPALEKKRKHIKPYNQFAVPKKRNGGEDRCNICTKCEQIIRSGSADYLEEAFFRNDLATHPAAPLNKELQDLFDFIQAKSYVMENWFRIAREFPASRLEYGLTDNLFDSFVLAKVTAIAYNFELRKEFFALAEELGVKIGNTDLFSTDGHRKAAKKLHASYHAKQANCSPTEKQDILNKLSNIDEELAQQRLEQAREMLQQIHSKGGRKELFELFKDRFPIFCSEEINRSKYHIDGFGPKVFQPDPNKSDDENKTELGIIFNSMRPGLEEGRVGGYLLLLYGASDGSDGHSAHYTSVAARQYKGKMYFDYFDPLYGRTECLSLTELIDKIGHMAIDHEREIVISDAGLMLEFCSETAEYIYGLRNSAANKAYHKSTGTLPIIGKKKHADLIQVQPHVKDWHYCGTTKGSNEGAKGNTHKPSKSFDVLQRLSYGQSSVLRCRNSDYTFDIEITRKVKGYNVLIKTIKVDEPVVSSMKDIIDLYSNCGGIACEWDTLLLHLLGILRETFQRGRSIHYIDSGNNKVEDNRLSVMKDILAEINNVAFFGKDPIAVANAFVAENKVILAKNRAATEGKPSAESNKGAKESDLEPSAEPIKTSSSSPVAVTRRPALESPPPAELKSESQGKWWRLLLDAIKSFFVWCISLVCVCYLKTVRLCKGDAKGNTQNDTKDVEAPEETSLSTKTSAVGSDVTDIQNPTVEQVSKKTSGHRYF